MFQNRGDFIQELIFETYVKDLENTVNARSFVKLLEKFPNVKSLEVSFLNEVIIKNWVDCDVAILGANGMISLELYLRNGCLGREFVQLFVANSVRELTLHGFEHYEDLIKSQQSISKLRIYAEHLKLELLKPLALDFFDLFYENQAEETKLLVEQLERDHLELKQIFFKYPMSPALLTSLCQKSNLERLDMIVDDINIRHLQQLRNLPKSTEVHLDFRSHDQGQMFHLTLEPLHNIEKMCIDIKTNRGPFEDEEPNLAANTISEEFFEQMGRNWSNIKELRLVGQRVLINIALEHMEKLKKLDIELMNSEFLFHHNSSTYPHMTSLIIRRIKKITNLSCLLEKLPNLKELSLDCIHYSWVCEPKVYYCDSLLATLTGMKCLEVLRIGFKIMSVKAIASEREISMLKKLCSKLKEFFISFTQNHRNYPFNNQVYEQLQVCLNMEVNLVEHEDGEVLILEKNV